MNEYETVTDNKKLCTELCTALYGGDKVVSVPHGCMAITATLCYDDSDNDTDSYRPHVSLSPEFALLVVPKQRQTQHLARRGIAGLEMFDGMPFKWRTEKYAMGHGNYLMSDEVELLPELQGLLTNYSYRERHPVTHAHWDIEFRSQWRSKPEPLELPAMKGFKGTEVTIRNRKYRIPPCDDKPRG